MGNSSSGPEDRKYDARSGAVPKDGHMLRLWAEVFKTALDPAGSPTVELRWRKVTEDIVPVNVSCSYKVPLTVFHVVAYNSQVEKVCDTYIEQPGYVIDQPSESFVHWRAKESGEHWGLNFTSKDDAVKFKTICTMTGSLLVSKSSSFGTMRIQGRSKGTLKERRDPTKSMSSPAEIFDGLPANTIKNSSGVSGMLTLPRSRQQTAPRLDSRSLFLSSENGQDKIVHRSQDSNGVFASMATPAKLTGEGYVVANSPQLPQAQQLTASQMEINMATFSKGSTLCEDNLRSILYGSSGMQLTGSDTALLQLDDSHSSANAEENNGGDSGRDDDTATVVADQSTLTLGAMTPVAKWSSGDDTLVPPATESSSSIAVHHKTSSPRPATLAVHSIRGGQNSWSAAGTSPVLQSSPLGPGFGSEASAGDPDISLPTRRVQSLEARFSQRSSLADWLPESATVRLSDGAYTDSGFGGTVGSEPAESVRSSTKSDGSGTYPGSSANRMFMPRRPGSSASSYSSGSGRAAGASITRVKPFSACDSGANDDDDSDSGQSVTTIPATESVLSLARQAGATRKAGWLEVKNWLVRRGRRAHMAPRRKWKRYWVSLKGGTLLFYSRGDSDGSAATATSASTEAADANHGKEELEEEESLPRHLLVVGSCLAQPVPEHPRRQHVFALSTAHGDAYLFQAQSQIDHDHWIAAIHSACASQCARQLGRDDTTRMLLGEIQRLELAIEQDLKMKKMAELQLSIVKEVKSQHAITQQIATWDGNLECNYMDQYRYRCYLAALRGDGCGDEQPNPKTLLSAMSRLTKASLSRLGILSVTTFHSHVCCRLSDKYGALLARSKRRGGSLLSAVSGSRRQTSSSKLRITTAASMAAATAAADGCRPGLADCVDKIDGDLVKASHSHSGGLPEPASAAAVQPGALQQAVRSAFSSNSLTRVELPNEQTMVTVLKDDTTVEELLESACSKRQLVASDCFLRVKLFGKVDFIIPRKNECLHSINFEKIEVCSKVIFQVELGRTEGSCGLQIEAELAESSEREDELRVFVCAVTAGSAASDAGLIVGDEILVINSKIVSDLDMVFIESLVASSSPLRMTVRSCRTDKPATSTVMQHADVYINNMMCPPPPSQSRIPDKFIDELIVPAPHWVQAEQSNEDQPLPSMMSSVVTQQPSQEVAVHRIKELLQSAEQVTHLCRMANERQDEDERSVSSAGRAVDAASPPAPQPLSEAQKLRKVVVELISTERAYVKDLNCLIERYLEPLKEETFLSSEEVIHLFGNIQEIVHFQRQFLQNLEEAADTPEFAMPMKTGDLKGVLFSIAGSFLYYANHFKLYSSFCASHSRAQKVFSSDENRPLKEFLRARNPKQQHSATLESYLIKPIQRVLKYPLLLAQLQGLAEPRTDERAHLGDALRGMEAVAEHINEMQKIYEEYGNEFDELTRQHNRRHHHHHHGTNGGGAAPAVDDGGSGVTLLGGVSHRKMELNVGELYYYGEAEWLNATDTVGKPRKGFVHVTTVFVFKNGVVFLCQEKAKTKKRFKGGSVRNSMTETGGSCETCARLFMPVEYVQVRTLPTPHAHGPVALWELLHLKSAAEGRSAEKIYQLANKDIDTRTEFMKFVRQIIRDSVSSMALPKGSHHGEKSRVASAVDFQLCRIKNHHEMTRYSMNFDVEKPRSEASAAAVPERSRTVADLQCIDGAAYMDKASLSQASMESVDSTGARLVYSSQDPVNYSSRGSLEIEPPGSPIWKQRPAATANACSSPLEEAHHPDFIYPGSVYTDSRQRSMLIGRPHAESATEC